MSYLFTPNFRTGKGAKVVYEELVYLMGKFTIIMQDGEFGYLPKNLKEHFTHLENPEQQSQGPTATDVPERTVVDGVPEPSTY